MLAVFSTALMFSISPEAYADLPVPQPPTPGSISPLEENKGPVILITRHGKNWAQMLGHLCSAQNPIL